MQAQVEYIPYYLRNRQFNNACYNNAVTDGDVRMLFATTAHPDSVLIQIYGGTPKFKKGDVITYENAEVGVRFSGTVWYIYIGKLGSSGGELAGYPVHNLYIKHPDPASLHGIAGGNVYSGTPLVKSTTQIIEPTQEDLAYQEELLYEKQLQEDQLLLERQRLEQEAYQQEIYQQQLYEQELLEQQRLEQEALAAEKLQQELYRQQILEAQRLEAARIEQERLAVIEAEKQRLAVIEAEKQRLAQEQPSPYITGEVEEEREEYDTVQDILYGYDNGYLGPAEVVPVKKSETSVSYEKYIIPGIIVGIAFILLVK